MARDGPELNLYLDQLFPRNKSSQEKIMIIACWLGESAALSNITKIPIWSGLKVFEHTCSYVHPDPYHATQH